MSAKWRRSRKHMDWLELRDFKIAAKPATKTPRMEAFRTSRVYPQKFRLPNKFSKTKYKEPKPLIDMFQDSAYVTIIAQIAGFNQDTVKISIKDQKLTLSAKAKDRRYYKSLNLPKVVLPTVAHTSLKNGVLQIRLKKATKQETLNQEAGINDAT